MALAMAVHVRLRAMLGATVVGVGIHETPLTKEHVQLYTAPSANISLHRLTWQIGGRPIKVGG